MKFNGNRVTDHNRSPISVTYDRIESKKRMANGTMRTLHVAEKRKFRVSWKDLPKNNVQAVDGFWSALALATFYETTIGEFTLTLTYGDNSTETVTVMFDEFSTKLNKRSYYTDLYDVDLGLVEV